MNMKEMLTLSSLLFGISVWVASLYREQFVTMLTLNHKVEMIQDGLSLMGKNDHVTFSQLFSECLTPTYQVKLF